jgi:RNA polymerase sigma factor (sigma-70 family)
MSLAMPRSFRPTYPPPFDDAAFLKSAHRMIRKQGVRRADVEDVIQLVLVAFSRCTTMPAADPDRTRYQFGIIRNIAIDIAKDEGERVDRTSLQYADAIAAQGGASPESVDYARRLHEAAVERDPQAADWVVRSAVHGEKQTELAEEAGVPVDRVRKRIERLSTWLRENASKLAALFLVVVGGAWAVMTRDKGEVAHPAPPDRPEEEGTPAHRAAALRSKAASECGALQWRACLKSLDDARGIDPAGDAEPRVQRLRHDAEAGLAREQPREQGKP